MKKIINIKGMHCVSCEIILEKDLKKVSGVDLLMVNHKKGIMEVKYKNEFNYDEVVKIIEKNGFSVKEEDESGMDIFSNILTTIIVILVVVIFYIFAQFFDLYKYMPDTTVLSYSSALLVGLIASVSTCLAITGGIIIGFSRYIDSTKGTMGHLKVQLAFQAGRILGFFVLGGVLGVIGKAFSLSVSFTGVLTFFVGFLLLYMGLNILGVVPSLTKFGLHMPKKFAQKIENLGQPKYAPIVGVLTFFLPCGFTQTMQLLAVGSGSFWSGGLVMAIFAIGTAPVLFSVGLGSSYFKENKFSIVNKLVGVIVVVFGIFTILNSYNLLKIPGFSSVESTTANTTQEAQFELVELSHDGWNTVPKEIRLKAGKNYKIVITPEVNGRGCMSTQIIPSISRTSHYVRKGVPMEYNLYDAKPATHNIVCTSMGMLQGRIIVE